MRISPHLIVALLSAGLASCAVDMPSDPNRYSLELGEVAHLRAPQTVVLSNAYSGESKMVVSMGRTLTFDRKQMTDTAVAMLSRVLEKQGIASAAAGQKAVVLRVRPTNLRQGGGGPFVPMRTATLLLDFQLGDGTTGTLQAEHSSPGDFDRSFDGAILFALRTLVKDKRFVAYMNAAPTQPAPVSSAPCAQSAPKTWTDCVGTYEVPDGSKYTGQFKDGRFHGPGELTLSSGIKYVGEFKDGRYHGQGVATSADGSVIHSGFWANGRPIK